MTRRRIHYDELIIRFKRQTYYEDENVYHASLVSHTYQTQGGDFRADVHALQTMFDETVAAGQYFANADATPWSQMATQQASSDENLSKVGTTILELLPDPLRNELPRILQQTFKQNRGLHLILEARAGDKADQLMGLPWELMVYQETGSFLARSPRLLVTRRVLDAVIQSDPVFTLPLQVVHVVASGGHGQETIDSSLIRSEQDALATSLGEDNYHLVTRPGSVARLLSTLSQTHAQIIHFLGHGRLVPGQSAAIPFVELVDESGQVQYVSGESLRTLIEGTPGVQLIVLNVCQSGAAVTGSLALNLVYHGFPYVVAMQSDITQQAAKTFISSFYDALKDGHDLAEAVALGRHAIASQLPGSVDWALPVLYTSVGITEKSSIRRTADALMWGVFRYIGPINVMWGISNLTIAILLWISGQSPRLPQVDLFLWPMGVQLLAPPLLTWLALAQGDFTKIDPGISRKALAQRILGATWASMGLFSFWGVFFAVITLSGLGFWELLSLPAQILILLPLILFTILISFAQSHLQGVGFLNSNTIRKIPFDLGESIFVLVGVLFTIAPIPILYFGQVSLRPPLANLLIGAIILTIGVIWIRDTAKDQNARSPT